MPRRATTSEAPENVAVKKEKIRVKEERQKTKGKQRAPAVEEEEEQQGEDQDAEGEDEDAEGDQEEGEGQESGSPRGSKRVRVNGEGDSVPSASGSQLRQRLPKVKTLPRDTDGYIPGSIVRIQLHNFVTYDYVQFRPGPYLNMILGPNGTGKSSIACAIALGLNFPPAILGRATDLNSFVKNGFDTGYIEIELKSPKGRANLIIRRNLSSTSNSSTFSLNGASATGTEIKQKMLELNVQVGNLCSFLPQDKVSEFAAMSPQQLLRETQRAAGDENLTNWHDTLISAGKDLKQMLQIIKGEEDSLKQMIERNEGIERDVQRYHERQKIEHTIELLNVLIPVAEYRGIREQYLQIRATQRKLHAKVQKLKDKNAPAHALLKKMEGNHKHAEKEGDNLKKATQAKFRKLQEQHKASEKLDRDAEGIVESLSTLKQEERERVKQIKTLEHDVAKCVAELEKPPPDNLGTKEALNDEKKQIHLERMDVVERRGELDARLRECIEKKVGLEGNRSRAHGDLKKQDDADVQKLQMMSRWDKDTHDTIIWLRNHKHLFKMEVFETPFMCLTVRDRRYTNAVEACFNGNQLKSFIAQCQEDCDTLNHHINDEGALGRKARVTTWFRPLQENTLLPPPMSREELAELHFDGYAIDYVDYPAGMSWFLTKDINLHRTAVALNGGKVNVNKAMEYVARPGQYHAGGANFINGETLNIVTRSRYGRKAIANMTRDVQRARNLIVPTIDPEIKQRLDEMIRTTSQEIEMCDSEKTAINKEIEKVMEVDKGFQARMKSVEARKEAIVREEQRVGTAKAKLARNQKKLTDLRNKPSAEHERVDLKRKLLKITKKRVQHAKEYTDLVHAIVAEQTEYTRTALKYLQIGANKGALQALCNKKDERYQTTLAEFQEINKAFTRVKEESKEILNRSRATLQAASEEIRNEYHALEDVRLQYDHDLENAKQNGLPLPDSSNVEIRTADALQAELETQQAKLEMGLNTNAGVVEQYEKRKRDIEQLEQTIADRKKRSDKVETDIKNARDNWQPALEKLVASIGEKFSAAFDRIGCAGEIRISQHEDYEKWAIDILVKFRDSEKLQLLTAHRQSGGERSLTTILYLMSLTEEARAPFSLVDEINQGMDQRAERVVHNSMVNVTCKADSAQYFLITPKLLPDLSYHERMKILCVNNGEWLPEERNLGKMMDMIDGYVESVSNAGRDRGQNAM
ncbi:P-loop containing nucleoside triphosphate hydrolase protein [Crassisporium funariophilum]|nr:P-loop containing nucleoside triphosphate hydrolase protein [Crassisporium funariophilum]